MAFKPQYLQSEEVDAIFEDEMRKLEEMHIRSLVVSRHHLAYGKGNWDPDTGEALMDAVRAEWLDIQLGFRDESEESEV